MDYILWDLLTDLLDGTWEGVQLFCAHPMIGDHRGPTTFVESDL